MDHRTNYILSSEVDTIAAVSTPSGEGGIGVIRMTGPQAAPIALEIFRRIDGTTLENPEPFHQYYGQIRHPESGAVLDEVLLSMMRAPRSYTREDMAEISAHGGPIPLRAILSLVCERGARLAAPGEFTQRAFLHGRIDLTQAEAVLDTIRARTDAGLRAAQQRLQGALGTRIRQLRERLIRLLASLEAAIDYADEELTFLTPEEIAREIAVVQQEVTALVASHARGKLLRDGAGTAIVGRPNTGKSSLLNALLGESRAIVTEVPGTTRDLIEEQVNINGVALRLIDTAGIRSTVDPVERLGVERSRTALLQADLILLVLDGSLPLTSEDLALIRDLPPSPTIAILNKSDLPAVVERRDVTAMIDVPVVPLSALTGEGLDQLEHAIGELLLGGTVAAEQPMLATLRQREAAEDAACALAHAATTCQAGGSEELLAVDLMAAAGALGRITGDDVRDDVIRELFTRFCVGK